jgi:hypothetical protein
MHPAGRAITSSDGRESETRTRWAFKFGNRTTPRIQAKCSGLLALRPRLATGLPFRDRFLAAGVVKQNADQTGAK